MKFWPALIACVGLAGGLVSAASAPADPDVVLVTGDFDGYLSPCGCTAPMIGGVRRLATVIKSLQRPARTLVLGNGGLTGARTRQEEMKAQTAAEILGRFGGILHLTPSEARFGPGLALTLAGLTNGRLVATVLQERDGMARRWQRQGVFLIGGVTLRPEALGPPLSLATTTVDQAVQELLAEARTDRLVAVLMIDGDIGQARALARRHPGIGLLIYRNIGSPPLKAQREGATLLATAGDHGKHLVHLTFRRKVPASYRVISLGPEVRDDPAAERIYREYLRRVGEEDLLARVPRLPSEPFSGAVRCGSCHSEAAKVWERSRHATALETLEHEGHEKDPDCVSCHVTGLEKQTGFKSRKETPQLASVGCESCHDAGSAHAADPQRVKMALVGQKSCQPCHTPSNSPTFDFEKYWAKIRH